MPPKLDPHRELPAGHELLDFPPPGSHKILEDFMGVPPHHRAGWSWLFSLVISTVVTFSTTLALIATDASLVLVSIVGLVLFVFSVLLVHAVAERAK